MSEIESQLKSLKVNTQRQSLGSMHHIRDQKPSIIQDLPHSCKYVNSFEVYDSCKYDRSNIVDVRNVNKESKINVNTTFVNNYDDSNIFDVRHVNKVKKVKSTCVNNHNNSDNEKLKRRRCYVCFCNQRVCLRGLASVGDVSPCIIVVEVASWKGGSNIRFSVKL